MDSQVGDARRGVSEPSSCHVEVTPDGVVIASTERALWDSCLFAAVKGPMFVNSMFICMLVVASHIYTVYRYD